MEKVWWKKEADAGKRIMTRSGKQMTKVTQREKEGGGVKKERGGGWKDSARPNVYISHHGISDARHLADKTDPSLKQRQKRTLWYRPQLASYAGQTTFLCRHFLDRWSRKNWITIQAICHCGFLLIFVNYYPDSLIILQSSTKISSPVHPPVDS